MLYSEQRAAQIAAFFISKAGGRIEILKLMKLMYFAERESFKAYGEPMTGDRYYSLDHGPILSKTLDHINNMVDSEPGGWESWIQDRENHLLSLREEGDPTARLTLLSEADIEILESTWSEYGRFSASQLRNLSHEICDEWDDPDGSRLPILVSRILKSVGHKDPDVVKELTERIEAQRVMDMIFDRKLVG
ncbi:MAG: Panacea domain-containing protein [Pseudomonadales bacterium]